MDAGHDDSVEQKQVTQMQVSQEPVAGSSKESDLKESAESAVNKSGSESPAGRQQSPRVRYPSISQWPRELQNITQMIPDNRNEKHHPGIDLQSSGRKRATEKLPHMPHNTENTLQNAFLAAGGKKERMEDPDALVHSKLTAYVYDKLRVDIENTLNSTASE